MITIRRLSQFVSLLMCFSISQVSLVVAQTSKKIPSHISDKDLIDSALQSSQSLLYSPIITIILYLSILFILLGIVQHHGKTIAVSSFIVITILFGRNFSDTIFTSFQVFQVSFIGPVFCLVLIGKLLSSYLKNKQNGEEEFQNEKQARQRYHQVQSRSTLRKSDNTISQNSRVVLNPITGASKIQSGVNNTSSIGSQPVSASTKLIRPI